MTTVQKTRNLPASFKALRKRITNWCVNEGKERNRLVESGTVAFVRHHFTNYESVLEDMGNWYPQQKGATEEQLLSRHFAMTKEYEAIKQAAKELAETMLNDAYGKEWTP